MRKKVISDCHFGNNYFIFLYIGYFCILDAKDLKHRENNVLYNLKSKTYHQRRVATIIEK